MLVATVPAADSPQAAGDHAADGHAADGETGPAERIIGTIMLQQWPYAGEAGPGEAEIRALAVRPEVQGQGVGRILLRLLLQRACELGIRHLVLCTEPTMRVAHRLYEQEGFIRLPERDWSPAPGTTLLVYGMRLNATAPSVTHA